MGEVGEFALVDLVRERAGSNRQTLIGPGDDAAHLQTRDGTFVVSSDLLIEGRHFRRDWSSAVEVGRKAAAANLSDINAMGGVATALTVSLGVPAALPVSWVLELAEGFEAECAIVGAHVVGGDVTAADQVVIAVTAMGDAAHPVRRDGAAPGDIAAFAGVLGLAGAGFAALSRGFRSPKAAVDAHRVPEPPYAAGPQAADAGATAMIDVSDGLATDARHVADRSGVELRLRLQDLPRPAGVTAEQAATGGDDYELLVTFPPERRAAAEAAAPLTWIGEASAGSGLFLLGPDGPVAGLSGYEHP